MKLLLDTHTFLWFIDDDPQLSRAAAALIEADNDVLLSVASLWEIAIKVSIGKLTLAEPYATFIPAQLARNEIELLPLQLPHLSMVASLPFHHRDPFDRMLVAQATVEGVPIISIDAAFDMYGVECLW
jgi:PIN domain nuclease of toxin-antitoxin system